jgi:hypothetical protein
MWKSAIVLSLKPSVGNDYIKLTLLDGDKDDNDYFATLSVGNDYIKLTLLMQSFPTEGVAK